VVALIGRVVRFGHADGRVDAREVSGRVVAVVRVRAAAVDGRHGRGVHRLGLDLGGRPAGHHQVLRRVLQLLQGVGWRLVLLLVVLVRPRVIHRRFVVELLLLLMLVEEVVVRLMSVAVAVTPDDATKAAVRTFARVIVVDAVGPAARRAGTVLRSPL